MFTKPVGFALGKKPRGFIPYMGKIQVD